MKYFNLIESNSRANNASQQKILAEKCYINNNTSLMNSMGRIAVIDAQVSGISGDMLLSSLVDAGANKKRVTAGNFCMPKISQGK